LAEEKKGFAVHGIKYKMKEQKSLQQVSTLKGYKL
jgi:hypothetical protein